jgi:PAS domain S-box-containing protein
MHDETRVVRAGDGRARELVGYWFDITARKPSEDALASREEIFSSIVAQALDAIVLVDVTTGAFLEFNRSAHEGLGYTREEFAKLALVDIQGQHSAEQIGINIHRILQEGGASFETHHRHRDGRLCDVRVSARRLQLRGRDCITAVWNDITEAKKAAAALQRHAAELRTHNETLSRFNHVAVGRELRMIELKHEINELCARLGEPPRHRVPTKTGGSRSPLPPPT